uniref:Uncharacterized protein n=1 Tax=Solanum tuberosum TaxID=4113 RepID=M1DA68_SOLTU
MPMREFHALHRNICTLKDLPVGQHHSWMIAWSMGGLTKRRGASEECAPFGELEDTLATRQSPLARVLGSPTDPMSIKCMSPIASDPGYYDMGCVKGLGTKRIDFPIFEGRRDPEAYLDWEWQCEKIFQRHDLRGPEQPLYALGHLKGLALGWWTQEERLRALQGNTHPLAWEGLKGLMRFKYVPKRYTKLFNVDPRRPVLRTKVGICGALGLDLILDDGYNLNYITPEVDSYVGTSMIDGRTQVPAKDPTIKGVMDALTGCSNIQGKKDLSCGSQGTIANLNAFTSTNEQSVNVSLSICEPIISLPCIDNVLVENVDTLADPIDDRIDSSSKIDLCPPSVDTYALNASSLFYNDCFDQPICECSSLVEGSCNVIK